MRNLIRDVKAFGDMIRRIVLLMNKKQQKQGIGVFIMIVMGAAFETLGVAAVLPFISAIMDPGILWGNKYIQRIAALFHIENDIKLIVFLAVTISAVYFVKNVFLIATSYVEAKYRSTFVYNVSQMMLHSYMKQPYAYFLNTNSAEIVRGVTQDANAVSEMMGAMFKIFSVCLMIIGIGVFLLFQDPFMATGILALSVIVFLIIIMVVKKQIKKLGILKLKLGKEGYQYTYQAINGIKEITIMKREDYFIKCFARVADERRKADAAYNCYSASPERIIEAFFISGILLLVSAQLATGNASTLFIANLAAFAIGAMRILPSLSTLTTRMTQLVYQRPTLNVICENINAAKARDRMMQTECDNADREEGSVRFERTLTIDHISWKYPEAEDNVLENISIEIRRGEAIALVGKSGAGKTTFADIILGLLVPQTGKVLLDGKDISAIPYSWSRIVGYVPQVVYLMDDTIRNNVLFGIAAEDVSDEMVWNALEKAQLKKFVEKLPQKLDTVLGEDGVKFSGGQRQRIAIARALYHDPDILIFDEATAALDNETEEAVMESIDALKGTKTLIIIAHRLNTIRNCNRFFEVENKAVIEKRKEEVINEG